VLLQCTPDVQANLTDSAAWHVRGGLEERHCRSADNQTPRGHTVEHTERKPASKITWLEEVSICKSIRQSVNQPVLQISSQPGAHQTHTLASTYLRVPDDNLDVGMYIVYLCT
jgi:hypothetical protein